MHRNDLTLKNVFDFPDLRDEQLLRDWFGRRPLLRVSYAGMYS